MNRRWQIFIVIALLVLGGASLVVFLMLSKTRQENRYNGIIRTAAGQHQLPPSLVKAVVWRESRFNARARGRAGEIGLMQLTEAAAQEWADARRYRTFAHEQVLDPAMNIQAGCYYLSKLVKRYPLADNPYVFALADFNAGRANVLRWMKETEGTNSAAFFARMDFPGTREYIAAILQREPRYRREFSPGYFPDAPAAQSTPRQSKSR
ncbi:MAG: lytic transglycosylase domain-containing protein [Pedosphaera sp.]|nr:lytic transglycosylase domain-containing protein [Pedosphaera sp.]